MDEQEMNEAVRLCLSLAEVKELERLWADEDTTNDNTRSKFPNQLAGVLANNTQLTVASSTTIEQIVTRVINEWQERADEAIKDFFKDVIDTFPSPIAHHLQEMTNGYLVTGVRLDHAIDASEAALSLLTAISATAYLASNANNAECDRELKDKLEKGAWVFGDYISVLRKLWSCVDDWINEIPGAPKDLQFAPIEPLVRFRNRKAHNDYDDPKVLLSLYQSALKKFLRSVVTLKDYEVIVPVDIESGVATSVNVFRGTTPMPRKLRLPLAEKGVMHAGASPLLLHTSTNQFLKLYPLWLQVHEPNKAPALCGCRIFDIARDGGLRRVTYQVLTERSSWPNNERNVKAQETSHSHVFTEIRKIHGDLLERVSKHEASAATRIPDVESLEEQSRPWQGGKALDGHAYLLDYDCKPLGREAPTALIESWAVGADNSLSGKSMLCIHGWGGFGKSRLTWEWFQTCHEKLRRAGFEGAMWCTFYVDGFQMSSFVDEALKFVTGKDDIDLLRIQPTDRRDLLIKEMKGRKFLFVLDGFERKLRWFQEQDKYKDITSIPDEARCLVKTADADTLRVLVGSTESRFLVTSRLMLRDLEHVAEASCVRHEELTGLPEDAVLDLWKASVPTDRTEATRLKEMFKRVDNHPLAIAVFARRVNDFGSYDQWLKQQPDNSALESTFNGDAEQRISLLVDYAIQGIDEDARFVLKNLYKEKRPTRFAELVPLVSNRLTEDKLRQALELLFQRRLVGRDAGHTLFEAHPIVRSYVWNRLMNNCDPKDAATIRRPDERDTVLETVESLIKEVTDLAEKRHYDQAWRQIKDTLLQRLNSRMVAGRPEVQRLLMTFMTASSTNVNGLSLPLLETRSDQAELMSKLANVLDEMNESEKASIANRWAAAIYLQLGDYRNFLDRQRAGTWSQLYSGFLPNAVEDLIRVVADGCRQTADVSILFPSLCWLGLVSAIAGQGDLLSNLLKTDGQSIMGRWFLQTMAEACVYLGQYDAAIKLIYTAHSQPDDQDKEDRGQLAWESITLGAALVDGKSDWAEAARHLDFALDIGELDRYAIIQDFALAYHARVAVRQGKEAGLYFTRLDSVSRGNYSIPTTVHFLARAEDKFNAAMRFGTVQDRRLRLLSQAQFFAQKARESAGGKGSYGYAQGVTQAVDLENRCRKELGLAPAASGTNASPDIYRLLIDRLQPFHNSLTGGGSCEVTPFQLLESGTKSKAIELSEMDKTIEMESEETRAWWKEQAERVGTETAIRVLVELQELNASVDRLKAEATALRVRDPAQHLEQIALQRLKVRTLAAPSAVPILCRSEAEVTAWASQLREQCEHLGVDDWDNCLHSRTLRGASRQVILTTEDARVFQADADRRMAIDTAPHVARAWWQAIKLEYDGNQDPVVSRLAEAIASEGLTLGDFARHLEYPNPCCIRLAFSRHRLDRALMKHPFVHDVSNWTTEQVKAELDSVRGRIGWADANKSARQLWHAWEVSNENDPVTVLRIAEELAYRKATISDYYTAHVDSNTDHAQAILHYLDYKRLKDHETNRKLLDKARQDGDHLRAKELQLLIDAENAKPAELFPTEFTDTRGWSDEEIRSQLERVKKENLDWENTTKTAREWWTAFEQENLVRFVLVLRLAEELRYRRATITEFFLAYVYSNTDSIQANLHYLDYSRLKKQASVERTAPKPSPADVDIDEFSFTLDDFFGLKESGDEDSEITSDGEGAG